MRSPAEQEDFLAHGRFGERQPNVYRISVPALVKVGIFFGISCVLLCAPVFLHIGRDDGGPSS
jgi:hypothetical protein